MELDADFSRGGEGHEKFEGEFDVSQAHHRSQFSADLEECSI